MSLYPTVPVCIQLTDYELEMPHLGLAPIYSVVPSPPPPYNPAVYPPSPTPFFEVEPPHCLPQYVALVGIHPMHQKINNTRQPEYPSGAAEEKINIAQKQAEHTNRPWEQKTNNTQKQVENTNRPWEKQKQGENTKSAEEKVHLVRKTNNTQKPDNKRAEEKAGKSEEEKETKIVTKDVILNKKDGKLGIKTAVIHKNIFIYQVKKGSGAAQAGLRLGDQIVKVNGTFVTGMSNDGVHSVIKSCPPCGIKLTIRTRRDNTLFRTLDSLKKSLNDL